MRPEDETLGTDVSAVAMPGTQQYATRAEVEEGLHALTAPDYVKLTMIAASFCRQRRLATSVAEPKELLNQAVLKTLECENGKRWNKTVSLVRHLDRAMENISGHLVRERMKIVAFPDGMRPEQDDSQFYQPDDPVAEAEKVSVLLNSVFGQDERAKDVFVLRQADGFGPGEIQARLGISAQEYETINRRILRKISQFLKKLND